MFPSYRSGLSHSSQLWQWLAALGLSSGILLSPSLMAQAQVGLSPLVLQKEAQRGQSSGVITLSNGSAQDVRVRVYAEPFTYEQEKGFKLLDKEEPSSLVPYLQFAPRELVIGAESQRRVRFAVRFPPNLPEGEYRAVLFAEPLQASASGQPKIGIVTRVGATVYVQQGEGQAALGVEQAHWNAEKQTVQLQVENTGNAMARPRGIWQLFQGEQVVSEGKIGETSILGESDRLIPLSLERNKSFPSGSYQLSGELQWGQNSQPYSVPLTIPQR